MCNYTTTTATTQQRSDRCAWATVDPFAMMAIAKDLPTSHYDDYSLVFN
jgi:hypothetical protein